MNEKIIGENLRRYRKQQDISQEELAEAANIDRNTYRKIEKGLISPRLDVLQNMANYLNISIQELFIPIKKLENVRFRALKTQKLKSRDFILDEVSKSIEKYIELETLLDKTLDLNFLRIRKRIQELRIKNQSIESLALETRELLDIKYHKAPISDVCGLFEARGIRLIGLRFTTDSFFGLSFYDEKQVPVIVVNSWERITVERKIFSAVHEFAHLLLHFKSYNPDQYDEDDKEEKEADEFAGYFLMPTKAFEQKWNESSGLPFEERIFYLKKYFRISYKTVLYRLSHPKYYGTAIWSKFYKYYYKKYNKKLDAKEEPEAMTSIINEPEKMSLNEFTLKRLYKLVMEAYNKNMVTELYAAEILKKDLEEFRSLYEEWKDY